MPLLSVNIRDSWITNHLHDWIGEQQGPYHGTVSQTRLINIDVRKQIGFNLVMNKCLLFPLFPGTHDNENEYIGLMLIQIICEKRQKRDKCVI